MSFLAGFAVYFIIWWTVLFCVLPLNIQSQFEKGVVEKGTEPGAPVSPQLARKAAITSIIALVIFTGVYVLWDLVDI